MKARLIFPILILMAGIISCSFLTSSPLSESPTDVGTTPEVPVQFATPTVETILPTRQVQPTDTAFPTLPSPTMTAEVVIPPEKIQIFQPGPASVVTSPIHITGYSEPTFEQNLLIAITGSDNQTIATTSTIIQAEAGQSGTFSIDVAFEMDQDQPGRISIFDSSPKDGSLIHLSSVNVTLSRGQQSVINPPITPQLEEITITSPTTIQQIQGGRLELSGIADAAFEGILNVTICGEGGSGSPDRVCGTADNVIGTAIASITSSEVGKPGSFSTELSYTTNKTISGSVIVYSISPRDGGIIHLASMPVMLSP